MSNIVKKYPPVGNLQLVRYETNAPFECWRCRRTKISKLQAIVNLEVPRIICNGCYGLLLSLHEIKAKDIEPWLKANEIHDLTLKNVSAKEAAKSAEKFEARYKKYWKYLSTDSKRFLGTANYLMELLGEHDDLDFSPLIIELVKAYEFECMHGLLNPLRDKVQLEVISSDIIRSECNDKDYGKVARSVYDPNIKLPELGTLAHTIATLINSKKRITESTFLQLLNNHINSTRASSYFLYPERFVNQVRILTQEYRNPSAHLGYLSKEKYDACFDFMLGADGVLWELLASVR